MPSASTITAILKRKQMIDAAEATKHQAFLRFEHEAPNDLWQMDFKGDFAVGRRRCYPLTMLDDHSRFALAVLACPQITTEIARPLLTTVFRRYGLPRRITCDNGPPWGSSNSKYTKLGVWLLRLGIAVSHSRPHHPQTQGKDERFHARCRPKSYAISSLRTWPCVKTASNNGGTSIIRNDRMKPWA